MTGAGIGAKTIETGAQELGGLVMGARIHSGAMGSIYRATAGAGQPPLRFPAIVKVPRTARGDGGEGLLGFQTEAHILPALSGPHVPRFIAAGDIAMTPYLALEWIDGESLEAMMSRGRLRSDDVVRLGSAVADALHSIHRQGVIHLDLKPANVIIRPSGEAALIDFGMAHHANLPDLLAEENRFAGGSAPYVSPEQVLGSRTDPRSDLFALGVILYELATGNLPFGVPRTLAGLRDRLWIEPVPPRSHVPELPPWLQETILRCLEPDAGQRYQSAAHVAFDLRHPDQIPLTARARKLERAGLFEHARRWWSVRSRHAAGEGAGSRSVSAPVVMVAVDTMHPDDARHRELRDATARILAMSAEYRLICLSVVRGEPVGAQSGGGAPSQGVHLEHLVRLRRWVEPFHLTESRLSLHVIEALNPSGTLLEFARRNHVDLIVIGAPSPSQHALAWWRSVASGVTANAHCSVYVVRTPEPALAEP